MARLTLPFDRQCQLAGLPVPIAEHRFHHARKWRFDWAFVRADHLLAIEVEGAAFKKGGGRHTRGAGFRKDTEKYAEALILGWRVLRVLPEQMTNGQALSWVERILLEGRMIVSRYTIGEPVDVVPPIVKKNKPRDNWCFCWQAADAAQGRWVPIDMGDLAKARSVAAIAKKRRGLDAEARGTIVYLRTVAYGAS